MDFTMEQNKALIEHFPYLQPRSLWTDEIVPDYSYDHIRGQWELPDGWHRLFLLYCMSIKPILAKADFVDRFRFSQIKEKYGVLTIYDNGCPQEIYQEICDLNYIYTRISKLICQQCGQFAIYESRGWVSYFCKDCSEKIFDKDSLLPVDEPDYEINIEWWEAIKDEAGNSTGEYNKLQRQLDAFPYFEEYLNCLKMTDEEFLDYLFQHA